VDEKTKDEGPIEVKENKSKRSDDSVEFVDDNYEFAEKILEDDYQAGFYTSKEEIRIQIKALVARDLWKPNEYFQIYNVNNKTFQKAVEVLRNETLYQDILATHIKSR